MAFYDLVITNNIDNANVYKYLDKVLQNDRTLLLTATQNLKRIRTNSLKNFDGEKNKLQTFSELKEQIYNNLKEGPRFLSRADQKFILNQVIRSLFDGERQIALYKIRNDLFELYEYLISEEISVISEETLNLIAENFTNTERDIFKIYNKYYETLYNIKSGNGSPDIELDNLKKGTTVKLLSEILTSRYFEQVDNFDTIVFDGFLFFNDEQKKILLDAIFKKKNIVFIAKKMNADKDNFLLNYLFKPLEKEFNIKLNIKDLSTNEPEIDNAITFVKNNYLDFNAEATTPITNGFNFVEPFSSRDRELNYIINCISKYIKSKCGDDREKIYKMLANDIAIIIANDKEKYEHQLNIILRENGVFFLDHDSEILNNLKSNEFKDVLYRRSEFMESKVYYKTGKELTRQEKLEAFRKLYKGINISQKTRSFINYPIGQYILEIYKIVNSGMTCEGFKKILYSNWYYNVGLDTIKYDKFIKEFHYIEPYLQNKKTPLSWIKELQKLKTDKTSIVGNDEYRFHPLKDISLDSLDFLINQMGDIKLMIDNLSKVFGDINAHLKALNDNFLLDEILTNPNISNEFEKEVIKHLKEVIDNINKSNLITNIDAIYFSDNIKNMLTDYEREKAESSADELTLNVVNLENMQKFNLTFFCMVEEDKYPRPYKVSFPFSDNILEILENPKYEIEHKPSFIKTLDYHMRLEKFLFLNILDITKEQMIITQTEEENGKDLSNSIYIEDIFSMFKQDIKYKKLKEVIQKNECTYTPVMSVKMNYKDDRPIKLSDLLSYFICPKIYYYITNKQLDNEISYSDEWKLNIFIPALVFYKTLYKLGLEGKRSKQVYSLNDDRFISTLDNCFDEALKEELPKFDFLSNYEIKDIKTRTEGQLIQFIKRNIYERGIVFFSFDLTNTETFKIITKLGDEKNITIDSCLKIYMPNGYPMNYDISSQMDFLVRSAGGEITQSPHFDDLLAQILERNPTDDRIAMVAFMFFKLNVQLNSTRYRKDGIERLKTLITYITKQTDSNYIPSSYCRYCKFESVCKMRERGSLWE